MSIFVIQHLIYPAHFAGNKCRRINESPLYIYIRIRCKLDITNGSMYAKVFFSL